MGKDYESIAMYECNNCGDRHEDEQVANECCYNITELEFFSCEHCKKDYEENEKEAEECCSDELIPLIKKVQEKELNKKELKIAKGLSLKKLAKELIS